ncbi:MAG: glycerate kinase, partial [Oscillospiraceae bacterium]
GSVDCFLQALGGERITIKTANPFFEEVESSYGLIEEGRTAIIEMAASAGLPMIEDRKDPLMATTYGVGKMILHAAERGVKKIIVGLGGSATNDGGCGAAAAVGVRFTDATGKEFVPAGGTLCNIKNIDIVARSTLLDGVEIVSMCDIDNPMYGPTGASYVFGPQKGADEKMVEELDAGMKNLAHVIQTDLGQKLDDVPGTGAAGAMGAGMMAFFSSRLQMGIETVLETVHFNKLVQDADMVFTGEGKIDGQSLRGKVVIGVARAAKKENVPVTAIVGDIGDDIEGAYKEGVSAIFSINRVAVTFKDARPRAQSDLSLTMDNLMRFYKTMGL